MLVGCCHCDEKSESSIPSEPSIPSESISESVSSESVSESSDECSEGSSQPCEPACGKSRELTILFHNKLFSGAPYLYNVEGAPVRVMLSDSCWEDTLLVQPCDPCQRWTIVDNTPILVNVCGPEGFGHPCTGSTWQKLVTIGAYCDGNVLMGGVVSRCDVECFGCEVPWVDTIADATTMFLNPTLIYCGGNPAINTTCPSDCQFASCFPTGVVSDPILRDTRTAIETGSLTLRFVSQPSYLTTKCNSDRDYCSTFRKSDIVASGMQALRDVWNDPVQRHARVWATSDYSFLFPFGCGEVDDTVTFSDLLPVPNYDDFAFTNFPVGHRVAVGASPNYCTWFSWGVQGDHLVFANISGFCTGTVIDPAFYCCDSIVFTSLPKRRLSADVLAAYIALMTLAGRPPETHIPQIFNFYNWRWFPSDYYSDGTEFGCELRDWTHADWIRPNVPFGAQWSVNIYCSDNRMVEEGEAFDGASPGQVSCSERRSWTLAPTNFAAAIADLQAIITGMSNYTWRPRIGSTPAGGCTLCLPQPALIPPSPADPLTQSVGYSAILAPAPSAADTACSCVLRYSGSIPYQIQWGND